jgi:hypothetical protein
MIAMRTSAAMAGIARFRRLAPATLFLSMDRTPRRDLRICADYVAQGLIPWTKGESL